MPPSNPSNRRHGTATWSLPGISGLFRALLLVAAMTAPAAGPSLAAYGDGPAYPALFGSHEVRSSQLSLFPKWRGAVSRYFDESRLPEAPCHAKTFNRCHLREWTDFLAGLRDANPAARVREVNRFLNRRRYIIDPRNYGVEDYWATPFQFLSRDGDCEDYAIAKYFSLRALGFPADSMRIVVLHDLNLRAAHAILVVYLGDRALVLDNQTPTVVDARTILHYRPIYSINEEHWWLHRL
jgi:predicted transglutaminase-like cysteine proteinase